MRQSQAEPIRLPRADTQAPQGLEMRHLRYFVAVADAGTFTRAADRLFVSQPTLSQQIRRLEQIVGTPLLHRRRDGVRLTAAGTVLLEAAQDVLSAVDHAVSQARQAAGLGRPRLRVALPADLPECLAVQVTSRLRSAAEAAQVAITWLETALDAEFSPIRQRKSDAGLGWLTGSPDALAAPLQAMSLGEFEPEVWLPPSHPAARHGVIGLNELASVDVIHGPRRASPAIYERWLEALQAVDPRFAFTDPPFRHSLPMVLAFAATATRPTAVLTGPTAVAGLPPEVTRLPRPADTGDMTRVSIDGHPLTAAAALIWNGDLPRPLQQILVDTADGATSPSATPPLAAPPPGLQNAAELMGGEALTRAGNWNYRAGLHPPAAALLQVAVSAAIGSSPLCPQWSIGRALAAGATKDEISDALPRSCRWLDSARSSPPPEVATALDYDVEAALEEPNDHWQRPSRPPPIWQSR